MKLDNIDLYILKILQHKGRITNAQLAKDIGLSQAPTLERVKKLELSGVIEGYHATLNKSILGLGVSTFVKITLKGHNKESIDKFANLISEVDEVTECHYITGSCDFILKVKTTDIETYQQLMLDKVTNNDMISNMESMVILSTFKDTSEIPISIDTKQ